MADSRLAVTNNKSPITTRFAPSPSGYLHIGGMRTALFSWLYARHHQGQFILRIEDTDKERSSREAIEIIVEGLRWLGLDYDEGPHYQSRRLAHYKAAIQQLLEQDKAYYCYCSRQDLDAMRSAAMARGEKPKYNGRCRDRTAAAPARPRPVVRFKNPLQGAVTVDDQIQGRVVYQNAELDDLIIARPDGSPTYNLTVVVDDKDMGVSHVIRGDDHLNNTPRQMNIFEALGVRPPVYAHLPLLLGADGRKLSKRSGAASVLAYREEGYLPEALLNYLLRLGWSHGDQEIFSRQEMIDLFDLGAVNKSAAAINPDKLLWLNQHYLKTGDVQEQAAILADAFERAGLDIAVGPDIRELLLVQRERCKTVAEIVAQSRCFYQGIAEFDAPAARKHLRPLIREPLGSLRAALSSVEVWDNPGIHAAIAAIAEQFELKLAKLAQPLRVAVTGGAVSPSIDDTLRLAGRARTLAGIDMALEYINKRAA